MAIAQLLAAMKVAGGGGGGGAFPVIQSKDEFVNASSSTVHLVPMPATVTAGDLLLVMISTNDATMSTPTGWTALANRVDANYSGHKGWIYYKVATGSEAGTNVTFTAGTSVFIVGFVWRITGQSAAAPFVAQANKLLTQGGTTTAISALTPAWGNANTLWIAFAFAYHGLDPSTYPLPDNQESNAPGTAYPNIWACTREFAAATLPASNIVFPSGTGGGVFTIGIKPA